MKRVIEFRGFSECGKWVSGYHLVEYGEDKIITDHGMSCSWYIVDKETVGQRTPFNATDGTPIFEGMTVKATASEDYDRDVETGRVEMDKSGQFVVCNMECFPNISGLSLAWGGWETLEIVED